jgi:hypothetical protein
VNRYPVTGRWLEYGRIIDCPEGYHSSYYFRDGRFLGPDKFGIQPERCALFGCSGFRSVRAEGIEEAAEIFAVRAARREYGRRGYCRTFLVGSYSRDYSLIECSAFIGYPTGLNETTGHNIYLTVGKVKEGAK